MKFLGASLSAVTFRKRMSPNLFGEPIASPWLRVKLFLVAKASWESKVHSYKVEIPAEQLLCRYFWHSYRWKFS